MSILDDESANMLDAFKFVPEQQQRHCLAAVDIEDALADGDVILRVSNERSDSGVHIRLAGHPSWQARTSDFHVYYAGSFGWRWNAGARGGHADSPVDAYLAGRASTIAAT